MSIWVDRMPADRSAIRSMANNTLSARVREPCTLSPCRTDVLSIQFCIPLQPCSLDLPVNGFLSEPPLLPHSACSDRRNLKTPTAWGTSAWQKQSARKLKLATFLAEASLLSAPSGRRRDLISTLIHAGQFDL